MTVMKVFVTGASGLVGGAAARALLAGGHSVVGLTSKPKNADGLRALGITPVVGDMQQPATWRDAVAQCDAIVHAAAAFPDTSRFSKADVDTFTRADRVAVDGLLASASSSLRALVYIGGTWVYGDTGATPADESTSTANAYAIMHGKLETEERLRTSGAPVVLLRPSLVVGDGSIWGRYVVPMRARKRAIVPGNGRNVLSFVHADDVGQAARLAVERPAPGQAFNVAGDEATTLLAAVRAQADALGAPPPRTTPGFLVKLLVGPYLWPPVLLANVVTNAKAKTMLGFSPRYPRVADMVRAVAGA